MTREPIRFLRVHAPDRRVLLAGAVAVALLAVSPVVLTDFGTEIVLTGLVFVMLGVSWNLLAGYAGQISLGHAAFFGMGAFITVWFTQPTRAGLPASIEVPVLAAVLLGALGAALIALVTGPLMFRLRGHYFAVGTLALAAIVELVMLDRRQYTGGSTGIFIIDTLEKDVLFLLTLLATVLTVVVTYYVVRSPLGLGMRAIHDDEGAANSLGVYPLKYKMYAFVISSFFAGLAGALYGQYTGHIASESTLGVGWTIDTLVVVILGGMGTMSGPILGALVFLGIDELFGMVEVINEFSTTIEGALIILFIIFLPEGLHGPITGRFLGEPDGEAGTDAQEETAGDVEEV